MSNERMQILFSELAACRSPSARKRCERLQSFFHAAGPHLRTTHLERARATSPVVRRQELASALQALSGPLKTALGSGEVANVWEIAGLKRSELRNAAALAALWSPNLFPQTAPMFLGAFLDRLPLLGVSLTAEELAAGFAVRTEEHPLGDLGNRVDISVETRETLLMIEVKIDAPEGPGQVSRYSDVLNAKARLLGKRAGLVLLSPRPAKTGVAAHASWADVIAAAHSVTRERKAADRTFADHLLRQFAEHISLF